MGCGTVYMYSKRFVLTLLLVKLYVLTALAGDLISAKHHDMNHKREVLLGERSNLMCGNVCLFESSSI